MVNDVTYRDPTPNNFPQDYDPAKVDPRVKLRSDSIKHKQKGVDTREAMYQSLEIGAVTAGEAKAIANDTASRQDAVDQSQKDFEDRYNDQIAGNTDLDEVVDARKPKGKPTFATLGERLNYELVLDDALLIGKPISTEHKVMVDNIMAKLNREAFNFVFITDQHYGSQSELIDTSSGYGLDHTNNALYLDGKVM